MIEKNRISSSWFIKLMRLNKLDPYTWFKEILDYDYIFTPSEVLFDKLKK